MEALHLHNPSQLVQRMEEHFCIVLLLLLQFTCVVTLHRAVLNPMELLLNQINGEAEALEKAGKTNGLKECPFKITIYFRVKFAIVDALAHIAHKYC